MYVSKRTGTNKVHVATCTFSTDELLPFLQQLDKSNTIFIQNKAQEKTAELKMVNKKFKWSHGVV